MKGQAVFEFIVAAVLFFALVFYVLNFMNMTVSGYSRDARLSQLESRALAVSDYLVHVNLTKEWPVLSYEKMAQFDSTCNDEDKYVKMLEKYDMYTSSIPGTDIVIAGRMKVRAGEKGRKLIDCKQGTAPPEVQRAEAERYALSENGSLVNISVVVW